MTSIFLTTNQQMHGGKDAGALVRVCWISGLEGRT
jgi:hypothetical protein